LQESFVKNVEDVLPLSPMQELMLLHLASASRSEALLEQNVFRMSGAVDPDAMRRAWQMVLDRHPALRCCFVWQGLSKPVQLARRPVEIPWQQLDWRDRSQPQQRNDLDALLASQRGEGFDPSQAPLLRVSLIQISDNFWWMVFTAHHILFDRWSMGIVLREVLTCHHALRQGLEPSLGPARPYKDYLGYLQKQDWTKAAAFWREMLSDAAADAGVIAKSDAGMNHDGAAAEPHQVILDTQAASRLAELARTERLSVNTLAQAALGTALARLKGTLDAIIGVTVSSRPPALPGVEQMVGMFSNNLPLRIRIPRGTKLVEWLRQLHEQQLGLQEHESSPLPLVRECAASIPANQPLYEALLVFQNDPAAEALSDAQKQFGLELQTVGGHSRTALPLTVMVSQSPQMQISVIRDPARVSASMAQTLAEEMASFLRALPARLDEPVQALVDTRAVLSGSSAPALRKPSLAESLLLAAAADDEDAPPALSAVNVDTAPRRREVSAPSTPAEIAIARIWSELLRVQQISVTDNFFDIGGTSVLAVQAVERLKRVAKLKINPMHLAVQTLGQLASAHAGAFK
jgi:hypothetical protein